MESPGEMVPLECPVVQAVVDYLVFLAPEELQETPGREREETKVFKASPVDQVTSECGENLV